MGDVDNGLGVWRVTCESGEAEEEDDVTDGYHGGWW